MRNNGNEKTNGKESETLVYRGKNTKEYAKWEMGPLTNRSRILHTPAKEFYVFSDKIYKIYMDGKSLYEKLQNKLVSIVHENEGNDFGELLSTFAHKNILKI